MPVSYLPVCLSVFMLDCLSVCSPLSYVVFIL